MGTSRKWIAFAVAMAIVAYAIGTKLWLHRDTPPSTSAETQPSAPADAPQSPALAYPVHYTTVSSLYDIVVYPQLVDYKDPRIQTKVNAAIRKNILNRTCYGAETDVEIKKQLLEFLDRRAGAGGIPKASALATMSVPQLRALVGDDPVFQSNVTSTVTYAQNGIVSIRVKYYALCDGAYSTTADASMVFDLITGKQVMFGDLFKDFHPDAIDAPSLPNNLVLAILKDPAVVKQVQAMDSDCADLYNLQSEDFVWDFNDFGSATYFVDQNGIAIIPNFPHVNELCEAELRPSFDTLRPFMVPDNILARLDR